MKRFLCVLLTLVIVLPLLTLPASATSYTIVENGLTIADSKSNSSYSDGVFTATGAGGRFSATENTVTITNNSTNKANITFDYTATGYNSFTIDGASGSASGSIDWTLAAEESKTIKIKGTSNILSGGTDGILTIKNIIYTVLIEGAATITHNELGSVTVDGTAFTSGSTTGTLTETGAALVATPVSGASFVAWVNADNNEVLSQSATFQLKPYATAMNIQAVFTKADQPAYFMTNATMYTDLSAALTAASGGDKKVVVISSGTLTAGSTYDIPSGVTLLVPYSTSDYVIDSSTTIDDSGGQGGTLLNANMELVTLDSEGTSNSKVTAVMEPNTSVLYTLTIPSGAIMNVSGKLVVGGALVAGTNSTTGVCGATGGAHSNIQMDGTINVKSGGVLSTCGYILGNGTITAESGGEVYQPFVLLDHKDGHYLYAAKENNRWPVYRYSIQNIRCPLVLKSGSDMFGYSAVFTRKNTFAAARFNPSMMQVVGSGSDKALFLVNGTSMTMTYQAGKVVSVTSSTNNNSKGYYSKVGTTTMTFNGDASLGSIELSVVVLGSNYNMTSANSEVPIPYNFKLVQNSGTFNVANNMALLPGSTFTVNSGAFMTVASGKSFVIYNGLRDYATRAESVTLDGDDQTGGTWPLYHYPTADNLQSGGFSRTAELIVNGTLTVNGNLGGTVQTGGTTGKIVMGDSAGTSATGTFGVQNKSSSILGMTIAGSCGKTVRTLNPQVFIADSTTPILLQAGKRYVATGNGTNTISGYTYSVYGTHDGSATTESKTNLNAVVTGTWQCADGYHTDEDPADHICEVCGFVTECIDAIPEGESYADHACDICGKVLTECADSEDEDLLCDICGKNLCTHDTGVTATAAVPATCVSDGHKAYWQCNICKLYYADEACTTVITNLEAWLADETETGGKLAALGHTEVTDEAVAATCTETGLTEGKHCSVCNVVLVEQTEVAANGHTDGTPVVEDKVEATCVVPGSYNSVVYCTVCGTKTGSTPQTIPATNQHNYTVETADQLAPTCTVDGYKVMKCDKCDATQMTTLKAAGHTEETIPAVAPTCTQTGLTEGAKCSVCQEILTAQNPIAALGHDYSAQITDPTCTEQGYTTYTCSACGDTYKDNYVAALSHEWNDGEETTAPGCTTDGVKTFTCKRQGCGETKTEAIPAAHDYDAGVETTAPTCNEAGVKTYTCKREGCGNTYTEAINATGHTEETLSAVAPTCTQTGLTEGVKCSVCQAVLIAQETVPVVPHEYTETVTAPTCTEQGYTTHTCKACGDTYKDSYVAANNHQPGAAPTCTDAQFCTVCGEVVTDKLPHTPNVETASCTTAKYCTVCNTELEAKKAHSFNEEPSSQLVDPATCTKQATYYVKCDNCEEINTEKTVSAGNLAAHNWNTKLSSDESGHWYDCLNPECKARNEEEGHSYSTEISRKEATCTEDGKVITQCKCDRQHEEILKKTGHKEEIVLAVAPTCTETGLTEGKHCSVCNEVLVAQEVVDALGHTEVVDAAVAPTCTETGLTEGKHCSVCNAVLVEQQTVSAKGHTPGEAVVENEKAATCTAEGSYEEVVYCSVAECKHVISRETKTIEKTAHAEETVPGKAATCTETGLTEGKKCSVCGEVLVKQEEIPVAAHTEVEIPAVDATCVNPGKTAGVECSVCHTVITEPTDIEPTGEHNYVDGVCTVCGGLNLYPTADFKASMDLANELSIMIAFPAGIRADMSDCYVVIEKEYDDSASKYETIRFSEWNVAVISNQKYYYVTFNGITAREMTDLLHLTIYDADGNAITHTYSDSVRNYGMRRLRDTFSRRERTMVVDMLTYGAEAQRYFNKYHIDDLADSELTQEQKSWGTDTIQCENNMMSIKNHYGSALKLESRIELLMAFGNIDSDMQTVVTYTDFRGKTHSIDDSQIIYTDGAYAVCINAVVVADGRCNVTCKVYDGDTLVAEATDSMESYACRMINKGDQSAGLCEAVMKFSDSAKDFLING